MRLCRRGAIGSRAPQRPRQIAETMSKTSPQAQAKAAAALVFSLAAEMFTKMSAGNPDLKVASKEIRENVEFMLGYVTLYHAGLLCFETLIGPGEKAEAFDEALHKAFEDEAGEDPKPHIRRYLQYAEKVGDRGYVQFVGFSIAEALQKRDVLLAVEMCKIYADVIEQKLEPGLRKILS